MNLSFVPVKEMCQNGNHRMTSGPTNFPVSENMTMESRTCRPLVAFSVRIVGVYHVGKRTDLVYCTLNE